MDSVFGPVREEAEHIRFEVVRFFGIKNGFNVCNFLVQILNIKYVLFLLTLTIFFFFKIVCCKTLAICL